VKTRELFWPLILLIVFLLAVTRSSAEDSYDTGYMEDLLSDEEYPQNLDTLEEFIQSYYLLLDSNEYLSKFKFIQADKNMFEGAEDALAPFYQKLLELRNGVRDQVVIYQIGDSHIQSGYFSGTARSSLQKYFGNAGRGLVFPLKLAGTNQPDDYKVTEAIGCSRLPAIRGVSGYSLSLGAKAGFQLSTNNFFGLDSRFSKLTALLSEPGTEMVASNAAVQKVKQQYPGYELRAVAWDAPTGSAELRFNGNSTELHGLVLENAQPGLLYHSAGINGAGFYTLIDSPELFNQIKLLEPDLIVVSLGTNDAQGTFREQVCKANLERFMNLLRQNCPNTSVIFTLPPDSHKRGKHNTDIARVDKVITDYARANNCAWWDLGYVMGGKNSVQKWRKELMASKDLLHFTPKGYMLQGYLFYQAMIKSYKQFSEGHPDRNNR